MAHVRRAPGRRQRQDSITICDAAPTHELMRFARGFGDEDFVTAVSADGRILAASGYDGSLRLMDLHRLVTPDRSELIAAYDIGRAYRWDIRPASLIGTAPDLPEGRNLGVPRPQERLRSRPTCDHPAPSRSDPGVPGLLGAVKRCRLV
jgi:hypothetical protein